VDDVIKGRIKILFVSPERLVSPSFRRLFRYKWIASEGVRRRDFPPVSLFCVDEAHCISQWGHNFRPSFLRLRAMIDMVEPKSVLAITATAGPRVVADICHTLGISNASHTQVCGNISGDGNRDGGGVRSNHRGNIDADDNDDTRGVNSTIFSNTDDNKGVRILDCNRSNISVSCIVLTNQEERLKKVSLYEGVVMNVSIVVRCTHFSLCFVAL
jgi:superfamily II DNA helicase RecQ